MLSELVYISDRINIGDEQEIKDILNVCIKNNSGKITGSLLYSSKNFVQYLEGEYHNVKNLFDKIKDDPRHTHVQLAVFSPIKERIFPGWLMAEKQIDDEGFEVKDIISYKEEEIFNRLLRGEITEEHTLSKIIKKIFN